MKTRLLWLAGACGAPLALAPAAPAAFTGVTAETRPNAFGISVASIYARFDQPGDRLVAVAGTPASPLRLAVIGGTFYQHPAGNDRAPVDALVASFPSLAYDTFVTIGVSLLDPDGDQGGQPHDFMIMTPGWPGFGPSSLTSPSAAWSVTPGSPQGDPFNASFDRGDGRTLIAQLATTNGAGFEGTMLIQYMSGGLPRQAVVGFTHLVPSPGVWALLGVAGVCRRRRPR